MKVITHKLKADWGTYFMFMAKDGITFGRAYIYNDQPDRIFLDSLSVLPEYRGNGYGRQMQIIREKFGQKKGCKHSLLWVKEKSWQRKWYKRRGYKFHDKVKDKEGYIWMIKKL